MTCIFIYYYFSGFNIRQNVWTLCWYVFVFFFLNLVLVTYSLLRHLFLLMCTLQKVGSLALWDGGGPDWSFPPPRPPSAHSSPWSPSPPKPPNTLPSAAGLRGARVCVIAVASRSVGSCRPFLPVSGGRVCTRPPSWGRPESGRGQVGGSLSLGDLKRTRGNLRGYCMKQWD